MTRRVAILGATGSIGTQALEVVRESQVLDVPHRLEVVALSAHTRWRQLLDEARGIGMQHVLLEDAEAAQAAREAAPAGVLVHDSVDALLDDARPDIVLNAVVGVAGLDATLAALSRGIDVALANKESLVAAGGLCMSTAATGEARIVPVDSEHSALMQCLAGSEPAEIESLVLTASGGPFRGRTREELEHVSVEEALAHPTWSMGGKITVDSATLMNKGLELIEAQVLFGIDERAVEVAVHRHSIVHALVRHRDGSLLAHLGWPDMRVPIAYALHHPRRPQVRARRLELTDMPALEFEQPDLETFRCLALARQAARVGGAAPCVLNSANEVAVTAFMQGEIAFLDIASVVELALGQVGTAREPYSLGEVRVLDAAARDAARDAVAALTGARA